MQIALIENDPDFSDEVLLRLKKIKPRHEISLYQSAENFLNGTGLHSAELILLDIMLPGMTGIELASILAEKHPHIKILILTNMNSESMIFEAIQNGALGYILKSELHELEYVLETVVQGGAILTPTIALRVFNALRSRKPEKSPLEELTRRQKEILDLMVGGRTIAAVAEVSGLSPHTVHSHVKEIYKKLNVHNRAQLVGKVMKM